MKANHIWGCITKSVAKSLKDLPQSIYYNLALVTLHLENVHSFRLCNTRWELIYWSKSSKRLLRWLGSWSTYKRKLGKFEDKYKETWKAYDRRRWKSEIFKISVCRVQNVQLEGYNCIVRSFHQYNQCLFFHPCILSIFYSLMIVLHAPGFPFLSFYALILAGLASVVVCLLCFAILEIIGKDSYFCYHKKAVCSYTESRL